MKVVEDPEAWDAIGIVKDFTAQASIGTLVYNPPYLRKRMRLSGKRSQRQKRSSDRADNSRLRSIAAFLTNAVVLPFILPIVILALIGLSVVATVGELYLKERAPRKGEIVQKAPVKNPISNSGGNTHEAS